MSPRLMPSRFDTIRSWDGSQARAFEEITFQLLKTDAPSGSHAVRTGNPDGGVEWYATLPDGTEWGWQAKYIHDFNALLSSMTESVRRVVAERKNLINLTFVISTNLSTGTQGGATSSQRERYERKVARWKSDIAGASRINFHLVQESGLLERLALPQHRGRAWFWWSQPSLSDEWFRTQLRQQADAAGEKYRPDLQVDVPIQEDLEALGLDESVLSSLNDRRRRIVRRGRRLRVRPTGPDDLKRLHEQLRTVVRELTQTCEDLVLTADRVDSQLNELMALMDRFSETVESAIGREYEVEREWTEHAKTSAEGAASPPKVARQYDVVYLNDAVSELASWLRSTVGRALRLPFYLLTGEAGSGKTHLFLDATARAARAGRPAVFLSGVRFGRGDLWAAICDQLGLEPLGADLLLGALDAVGEASSLAGSRTVIFIDAANETSAHDFWEANLPALRAAIAQWPHVSLAISCRDTYLSILGDGSERQRFIQRRHPGFAGRELEATQRYLDHYRLEAPRIPLLVPEFGLPLFLRLYCESLADRQGETTALGHEGRVKIFQRYLDGKLVKVGRRLRPGASSDYEIDRATELVRQVVDALVDELAATGLDGTTRERGHALAENVLGRNSEDAAIVLGALQSEGVLTREILYLNDRAEDGFRIVFQAFSDFLILRRRLKSVTDLESDLSIKQWLLGDCSFGIIEAATIALPELYNVELADYLHVSLRDATRRGNDRATIAHGLRAEHVLLSLVKTLPYRATTAVTERTIEIFNTARRLMAPEQVFRIVFQMAPQPDNLLNAESLHAHLQRFKMPRRDAYFGFATYDEIWDVSSSVSTLARWAAGGPYPAYDARVIELAAIPLVWLLGSPNRFMRDWVTKALVALLRGHLTVAMRLFERFWDVDDPYIVQRVVVVVYGALMRRTANQAEDARTLVQRVRRSVFATPVRADELMLGAARGIIEWGVRHNAAPKAALKDARRPYGFAPPSAPPRMSTLENKYGWRRDAPIEDSYATIWSSIFSLGDFGRYVVESGIENFSDQPLSGPYSSERPQTRLKTREWKQFVKSLSTEQRAALAKRIDLDRPETLSPATVLLASIDDLSVGLDESQSALLNASWSVPRSNRYPGTYSADLATRWVFRRTLSLGWTPELFGAEDRYRGHGVGREGHKAERWGKKYQWMAYHELLARVADNFHGSQRFDDDLPYEGLHQIIAEREIDPSHPPVAYDDLQRAGRSEGSDHERTWRSPPIELPIWPPVPVPFQRYRGDVNAFIGDRESEPTPHRLLDVVDESGDHWILLEGYVVQEEHRREYDEPGLQQTLSIDSWLLASTAAQAFGSQLPSLLKSYSWPLIDRHGHVDCCFAGEVGWSHRNCPHYFRDFRTMDIDGNTMRIVPTTESVTWEGSLYDCSIDQTVQATFLQRLSKALIPSRLMNVDLHGTRMDASLQ
jgi:hypothetical protein